MDRMRWTDFMAHTLAKPDPLWLLFLKFPEDRGNLWAPDIEISWFPLLYYPLLFLFLLVSLHPFSFSFLHFSSYTISQFFFSLQVHALPISFSYLTLKCCVLTLKCCVSQHARWSTCLGGALYRGLSWFSRHTAIRSHASFWECSHLLRCTAWPVARYCRNRRHFCDFGTVAGFRSWTAFVSSFRTGLTVCKISDEARYKRRLDDTVNKICNLFQVHWSFGFHDMVALSRLQNLVYTNVTWVYQAWNLDFQFVCPVASFLIFWIAIGRGKLIAPSTEWWVQQQPPSKMALLQVVGLLPVPLPILFTCYTSVISGWLGQLLRSLPPYHYALLLSSPHAFSSFYSWWPLATLTRILVFDFRFLVSIFRSWRDSNEESTTSLCFISLACLSSIINLRTWLYNVSQR